MDHPDDPVLAGTLKEKVEAKTITGLIASLADAAGFAIVTDDFRGRINFTLDKDTPLRKAFNKVSKLHRSSNWNRTGQVIELWDVHWYDRRSERVSKAWLEALRRKLKENGTLDIDDLAQVAALTDSQLNRNFANDSVLRCVYGTVHERRDYLRVYASLTSAQRAMVLSDFGLAFVDLTPAQQQSVMKLILGAPMPELESLDLAGLGIRVTCTRETCGSRFIYTLRGYTNLGQIPGQSRFTTPFYIEPPRPQENKPPESQPVAPNPGPSSK